MKALQTKQPCVLSSDALHLLTATAGAMLLLPLEGYERDLIEQAIAQAFKAMLIANGTSPHMLPLDWITTTLEAICND